MIARLVVWLPTALSVAVLMDFWAALLHGRVWHRWLWPMHRSHHRARRGRFEANDALSVSHAPVAVALVLYGCLAAPSLVRELAFGMGIGMTVFGVAYVLVHDGLVHGRLPVRRLLRVPLLSAVARAHRVHHARSEGGPPYGLFFGPWELERHVSRRAHRAPLGRGASSARAPAPSAPKPVRQGRA